MEQITLFILAAVLTARDDASASSFSNLRYIFAFFDRFDLWRFCCRNTRVFWIKTVMVAPRDRPTRPDWAGIRAVQNPARSQEKEMEHKQTNIMCVRVPLLRNAPSRVSGTLLSNALN